MKRKPTLAEMRRARGYTQDALARSIERQLATVSNWEVGRSAISVADAVRICEVLDCRLGDVDWTRVYDEKHRVRI